MLRLIRSRLRPSVGLRPTYPPAPGNLTIYAIGDIHGRLDCLRRVQFRIDEDKARLPSRSVVEIYLGDYVDRGPDSKGVIDLLIERSQRAETCFLLGNHELILASYLRGEISFDHWRSIGGLATAMSYGVDSRDLLKRDDTLASREFAARFPARHREFISKLQPYAEFGAYAFVHAGVRPGTALARQSISDLAWIRAGFLDHLGDFGKIVVHGHTPVAAIEFLPNRINVDTGAYATNRLGVVRIDADGPSALESD